MSPSTGLLLPYRSICFWAALFVLFRQSMEVAVRAVDACIHSSIGLFVALVASTAA